MSSRKIIEKLKEILNLSETEIVKKASDQIAIIINTDEVSEESCIKLIIYAMQTGAKADGVLCAEEYAMAKALLKTSFDDAAVEGLRSKLEQPVSLVEIEVLKAIVNSVSANSIAGVKFAQALCTLMMCIIAIDKKVTATELEVLDDIFDEFTTTLGLMNVDIEDI